MRQPPKPSRSARISALVLALTLCACGGPFANAMKRGDEYMQAGMWDQAAAAYTEATRFDPADSHAVVKLSEARRRQSAQRMAQANATAARQDFRGALQLGGQALSLDPNNLEHQRQFNVIVEAAVQFASSAAQRGDSQQALDVANLVLQFAPQHAGAHAIASQVHQRLADDRFARANFYLQKGLRGNAIVELSACLDHVPSYPNARERKRDAYAALRRELVVRIGLLPNPAEDEFKLAELVSTSRIAGALNTAWPIEVIDQPDPATTLVLSGGSIRLSFNRDRQSVSRPCDYVCGVDHQPNPEHARAERTVADAERRVAAEEEDAARLENDVSRHQRGVDEAERDVTRAESDLDRARKDLASCRHRHDQGKGACRSEHDRVDAEQRDLEQMRHRLESPRQRLIQSREQWGHARERVHGASRARNDALERMRSTPRTIEVDRTCSSTYPAERHIQAGRLTLDLTLDDAASGRPFVSLRSRQFDVERVWETYRAQPGRCPSAGQGPPAVLPSDQDLRRDLEGKLLADVAGHVQAYVTQRLSALRAQAAGAEADGRIDDAIEGYVRYLMGGGLPSDDAVRRHIDELLMRARGVDGLQP